MEQEALTSPFEIPGLPSLNWLNDIAGDASILSDQHGAQPSCLRMKTDAKTDWFNPPPDPTSPEGLANAPALVFLAPEGNWQLSTKVSIEHNYLFDAATIFVHRDKNNWCKLCYEMSPERKPTIVSVVTRDISDDANGAAVDGGTVHLRVSKYDSVFAFHYSTDGGKYWTLHRAFCMRQADTSSLSIGFLAQCPTGESCTAMFSDIHYSQTRLADLRDGS